MTCHIFILFAHEQSAPSSHNHVKLPQICKEFDVIHVNIFYMLRALIIVMPYMMQNASNQQTIK